MAIEQRASDPELQQARINRKKPSGDLLMEEMGSGVFNHTLSGQELITSKTLEALKADAISGEPFQVKAA